jgi:hypothetical protein
MTDRIRYLRAHCPSDQTTSELFLGLSARTAGHISAYTRVLTSEDIHKPCLGMRSQIVEYPTDSDRSSRNYFSINRRNEYHFPPLRLMTFNSREWRISASSRGAAEKIEKSGDRLESVGYRCRRRLRDKCNIEARNNVQNDRIVICQSISATHHGQTKKIE